MSEVTCPDCGSDYIAGVAIRSVFDGILYWECRSCGTRFHRWPHGTAQRLKAARRIGKE